MTLFLKFQAAILFYCKKSDVNYSDKSIMFVENNKLYFNNLNNESIEILELQAEGKKIMKSSDFLRGNKL